MKIINESHTHELPEAVINLIRERFADRAGFFIETFELPEPAEDPSRFVVRCDLYGPRVGDPPVVASAVTWSPRPPREYASRMIDAPARLTRVLTVIAGPHGNEPCVLYTAFGGPLAPKEPLDPTLKPEEQESSAAFWAEHALASRPPSGR
jgi:hypothetical protein